MFFKKEKNSSIKSRLVISYIAIILAVGFLVSLTYYIYSLSMLEKQTLLAAQSIEKLADLNLTLHKENLEPLAEKFILAEAENRADDLSEMIDVMGGYEPEKFKNNKVVKTIITKRIEANSEYLGDIIVVDKNKNVIIASDPTLEGKNYEDIKNKYKGLFNLVEKGLSQKEFTGYYKANPLEKDNLKIERKFLAGVEIPDTDLYVFSSVYVQPYMSPIIKKINDSENNEINILLRNINKLQANSIITLVIVSLLLLTLLVVFSLLLANWLAKKIADPVISLKNAVQKIGRGDFDTKVEEKGTEETIELAKTFNELGNDLKKYIDNLAKEIAHRKHIESEIEIAREIQKSLLPDVTEQFMRNEFSLFAKLVPAENVAGDFFDFFYLNEEKNKLALILGDVSGKGIPAAFFMGIVRTVIRQQFSSNPEENPDFLLTEINKLICSDNETGMFVTAFIGIYNIETGELVYGNAGHHPSIKIKTDSTFEEFGSLENPLVGIFPNSCYDCGKTVLNKDETIVIYTDGISDAVSSNDLRYGTERIIKNLIKNKNLKSEDITKELFNDVIAYQNNVIFDDMTVLILKRQK